MLDLALSSKLLLLFLLTFSACGVKGPPRPPAGTAVPSFVDGYLFKDKEKKEAAKKDEKKEQDQEQDGQ